MKKTCIYLILSLTLGACSDDLSDLNRNPNEPDTDDNYAYNFDEPALGSVFRSSLPAIDGDDEQRVKSLMVDFYAQMLDGGAYDTRYYLMNDDWNARMFRRVQNGVANLNLVLRNMEANAAAMPHARAIAMIWRVYTASVGFDWFGPLPLPSYRGKIVANPPYISVEEAYNEFFAELDSANILLKQKSPLPAFKNIAYDIIFHNDVEKWRRFCNSLHLRLAMRLTEVAPERCKREAAKALAAGVMESATDNALLPPKANGNWGADYNYTMFQITWGSPLNLTASMEKLLTGIGGMDFPASLTNPRSGKMLSDARPAKTDPRASLMFSPAYETGDWKGRPDGLNDAKAPELELIYKPTNCAELGILFNGGIPWKSRPYDVFLYEEVCFLKAEAAARGFIDGDACAEYEKGVRASFATWKLPPATADAYLQSDAPNLAGTSPRFAHTDGDGNTVLEKIITQKYLALFPDMSQEAWNDKRRLNLPRTDVALHRNEAIWPRYDSDVRNPANYIRRVQYPNSEQQINRAEYNRALQLLDAPDRINSTIWWDKLKNYCTAATLQP